MKVLGWFCNIWLLGTSHERTYETQEFPWENNTKRHESNAQEVSEYQIYLLYVTHNT